MNDTQPSPSRRRLLQAGAAGAAAAAIPAGALAAPAAANAAGADGQWKHLNVPVPARRPVVVLSAGQATRALIIANESPSAGIRIRLDGIPASGPKGLALAPGAGLMLSADEVPSSDITAYADEAGTLSLSWC